MVSCKTFCELVGSRLKALKFEQQALSVGSEFLPEIARRVRDGETAKGEDLSGYWRWLTGQWVEAQEAMVSVFRIEHSTRRCMGPSDRFGLGVYAPSWAMKLPPMAPHRPKWTGDNDLMHLSELEPPPFDVDWGSYNPHVNPEWYFAFSSLDQLEAWFPLRYRKRYAYLKRGAVIREYRGPRVIFGTHQCVIHRDHAERVGTFHIYKPREAICPSTTATPESARIAG